MMRVSPRGLPSWGGGGRGAGKALGPLESFTQRDEGFGFLYDPLIGRVERAGPAGLDGAVGVVWEVCNRNDSSQQSFVVDDSVWEKICNRNACSQSVCRSCSSSDPPFCAPWTGLPSSSNRTLARSPRISMDAPHSGPYRLQIWLQPGWPKALPPSSRCPA